MSVVGIIVIARNEGEKLRQCFHSVGTDINRVVYVDSGSSDGSIDLARSLGVDVIELDLSIPFTAARARNAGFERLVSIHPDLEYVQFVDGDCELFPDWLATAVNYLQEHQDFAVVCGRQRERYPQQTIYNLLFDLEWDTPVGEALACGGCALIRVKALQEIGGYNPALIAGEEPEMCVRLRGQGWKIYRLGVNMTWHDAEMTKFSQWWKRSRRGGYAYANVSWLHGKPPESYWVKESRSIWLWGLVIPVLSLSGAYFTGGLSLLLLLVYPWLFYKIIRNQEQMGRSPGEAKPFALFCVLAKFPQLLGQIEFHLQRLSGAQARLIEYK
ncbi:MAG: hypothetical protein N5P05_002417 [Chroococcopsis gigantea SAG 12.99]|jgi:GT2 family glycosyltransferase|nr:glycosyltransferase family 2 protein [Chlorogloea purpurea SAG 13.99]MDV3000811.1 hypothetical protein [Chroococcopsis gigantea SAG 12.99]